MVFPVLDPDSVDRIVLVSAGTRTYPPRRDAAVVTVHLREYYRPQSPDLTC